MVVFHSMQTSSHSLYHLRLKQITKIVPGASASVHKIIKSEGKSLLQSKSLIRLFSNANRSLDKYVSERVTYLDCLAQAQLYMISIGKPGP